MSPLPLGDDHETGAGADPIRAGLQHSEDDGAWVSAIDASRNARLVLYVPSSMNPEGMMWISNVQVNALEIGLESETGRVMMRLIT